MPYKEKKICFARVQLPNGTTAKREVIVFDVAGKPVKHFPLTEELPFVEWHDETYVWDASPHGEEQHP